GAASGALRPPPADDAEARRDDRGAVADVAARGADGHGRFRLRRLQRPVPVRHRHRPRQFPGRRPFRPALRAVPAAAAPDHRGRARGGDPGDAVRRARRTADLGQGAARHWLPLDLDVAGGDRPGQGDAGRAAAGNPDGADGRYAQRADLREGRARHARGLRGRERYSSVNGHLMIELPRDRMDQVLKRFELVEAQMAAGPSPEAYVKLASEYSELQNMAGKIRELRAAEGERADLEAMLADAEMRELAEADLPGVEERIEGLRKDIQLLLLPRDAADEKNAILEIRAGTGGDEAALFAGDLYRMYERYAGRMGWRFELISASEGEVGGFKEAIASVSGKGVFAHLKFESGVHRVQRVPE